MITREYVDCNKSYDFKPLKDWPHSLPAYTWKEELLCAFNDSSQSLAIDLSTTHLTLAQVLKDLYPQLSFSELARLYHVLAKNTEMDWTAFFSYYNLKYNENLSLTLVALINTPIPFQNWCSEKQLSTRDLSILRCVKDLPSIHFILDAIANLSPSKSMGSSILEMSIELSQMSYTLDEIIHLFSSSADETLHQLRQLRFKNACQDSQRHNAQLQQLNKPQGLDIQWKRYGDRSNLEIKFFSENQKKKKKKVNSLKRWQDTYGDESWT
ncbi:MAG: hypothetical protein KDD40_02985 [Bdellovibrionales bacterium]|nr:hypothetical protein [Bdellovibrionales bacterium]